MVAPLLHSLGWAVGEHLPWLRAVATKPFHRFLTRSMMGIALVGLFPFVRVMGVSTRKDWGLESGIRDGARSFCWGVALGGLTLGAAGLLLFAGRQGLGGWPDSGNGWYGILLRSGLSALAAASLEELLFRGAILGAYHRNGQMGEGILVTTFVYTIVHFLQLPADPAQVGLWTGFQFLVDAGADFFRAGLLLPMGGNLFLAGLILGAWRARDGHVFGAFGLHASWIFCSKIFGSMKYVEGGVAVHPKLVGTWQGTLVLVPLAVLAWRRLANRGKVPVHGG